MPTIAWTSDLDTGIEPIDAQHRQLVDYINELDAAAVAGNRPAVARVLDELIEYTLSHFAFEEQLQLDAGYRLAQIHKSMHDVFTRRVQRYKERFDAGEAIEHELRRMLQSWLIHHIKRDDKAYVRELKKVMDGLVADRHEGGWLARNLRRFFR